MSEIMETETNRTAKSKMRLLLILGAIVLLLAAGGGLTYNHMKAAKYKSLVDDYNQKFAAIQTASDAFKKQVETPPADKKTLQEIINFYEDSRSKPDFEDQVKDLNSNPKYAALTTEKKDYSSLDVEKVITEYNDRLKDINKLQSVMQRSDNMDSEIKQLTKPDDDNYLFYNKVDELSRKNNTLKDEVLGVVLAPKLKDVQLKFVDALTYRGKYLAELEAAYEAESSYKYLVKAYARNIADMNKNKQAAQLNTYSASYISEAYKAADNAENNRTSIIKREAAQKSHAAEAASMLAKYVELMGNPSAGLTDLAINPKPMPDSPPRSSGDEEKAKLIVEVYLSKSMWALKTNNISAVSSFLSENKYKEQSEYMKYLNSKGIKETMTLAEAKSAEKLSDSSFKVTTSEKYNITYGDGSSKTKSFTSKYKVLKTYTNTFVIDEILETKETESIDN